MTACWRLLGLVSTLAALLTAVAMGSASVRYSPPPADPAIVDAVLHGTGYISNEAARNAFAVHVYDLLRRHQHDELEDLLVDFRRDRSRFAPDEAALPWMYDIFFYPPDVYRRYYIESIEAWAAEIGPSELPPLALGVAHLGNLWIGNPDDRATLYEEGGAALKQLEGARSVGGANPDVNVAALDLAALDRESNPVEKWFDAACSPDRQYLPAYLARGRSMSPRHKHPGNLEAFAEDAARQTASRYGAGAYPLIMLRDAWPMPLEHTFKEYRINWPLMRQGFLDLDRRWPGSLTLVNDFCHAACLAGDAETAAGLFDRLGANWSSQAWVSSDEFERYRQWARSRSSGRSVAPSGAWRTVVPRGREAKYSLSDRGLETKFVLQVRDLYERQRYADIDRIASALRYPATSHPAPGVSLPALYDQISIRQAAWMHQFETELAREEGWIRAWPDSVTARVAMARTWVGYAWHARGGGYAYTVTAEGWKLYETRLQEAQRLLEQAEALPDHDDPELYHIWMVVAMGIRGPHTVSQLFDRAVKLDPRYSDLYESRAFYLLPRWGGAPGEMEAFAAQAADRTKAVLGDGAYAIIAFYMRLKLAGEFGQVHFSWPRVRKGLEDLIASGWHRTYYLNALAREAYERQDRDAAAAAVARIRRNFDPAAWNSWEQFRDARKWSRQFVPAPIEVSYGRYRPVYGHIEHLDTVSAIPRTAGEMFGFRLDVQDYATSRPRSTQIVVSDGTGHRRVVREIPKADLVLRLDAFVNSSDAAPGPQTVSVVMDGKEVASRKFVVR